MITTTPQAGKTSLLERFHEAMRDNDDPLDDELTQEVSEDAI